MSGLRQADLRPTTGRRVEVCTENAITKGKVVDVGFDHLFLLQDGPNNLRAVNFADIKRVTYTTETIIEPPKVR